MKNDSAGQRYDRYVIPAILIIFAVLHIYRLTAPPNGYHKWRESDTAAVIQNYYQEDMSFSEPRINQRGATSGITGMELPIYNFSAALLYKVFGSDHIWPHLLTVLGAVLGLWFFYGIVVSFSGADIGRMALWALACSPLFFYYSFKIMPDIWMISLLLGAVFLYLHFLKTGRVFAWLFSAVLLALSAGIKPLGLAVYLPLLYVTWKSPGRINRRLPWFVCYIAMTLLPAAGWLYYARHLQEVYGLHSFYLGGHGLLDFTRYLFKAEFFNKLFLQWPFELWSGWVLTPMLFLGLYLFLRKKGRWFFGLWILAAYIVFVFTAVKSSTHDYYTMIIVPPIAWLAGVGLAALYGYAGWRRIVAIILIILAPTGAVLRIYSRFENSDEFYQIRKAAQEKLPAHSLVMVQDKTPAVRLYQLNRKGWPLRNEIKYQDIVSCVNRGAEYLVLEKPLENFSDSLKLIFSDSVIRLGSLYCYTLKH